MAALLSLLVLFTGCDPETVEECSAEVPAGGDVFEPDDCPARAHSVVMLGKPLDGHTLAPAGDVDWYRLEAVGGRSYLIKARGADGLSLSLDVFLEEGVRPMMEGHRGRSEVEARFVLTGSAPLLVRVSASDADTQGAYTLTVLDEADDFVDTDADAEPLPAGGVAVYGGFQFLGDVDVHALELEASTSAFVDAFSLSDGSVELVLELVAPDGTVIQTQQGFQARIPIHARTAGRYLLRVRATQPDTLGDYQLSFQRLGPDDHGDGEKAATLLEVSGSSVDGKLERVGDVDAFTFVPVPGHQYRLNCHGTTGSGVCEKRMFRSGADPAGPWESQDVTLKASDATPFILLLREGSSFSRMGTYRFTLTDLGPDDHADGPVGATPMTAGGAPVAGVLAVSGEVDAFTFTAEASRIYRFECTYSSSSAEWFNLEWRDPAGQRVGQVASGTSPFAMQVLAQASGAHVVLVSGGIYSLGSYTCQLTDLGADDHGNSPEGASALPEGGAAGEFQYEGDVDVFSAPTTAGRFYRATVTFSNTLSYMELSVSAKDGGMIASHESSPSSLVLDFKAATTPTVLTLRSTSSRQSLGTYSLTLVDLGTDDHGDTAEAATPLVLPATAAGALSFTGDVDVFSFAVTEGHVYRFQCPSNIWFSLRARDGSGKEVASGKVGTLLHEVPASGMLSVEVSTAGGTYGYSCSVEDLGTDDQPDTAEGALELSPLPASGTGVLETWKDVDVFTFRPTAGRIYRFSCTQVSCGVRLRGPGGAVLAERSPSWGTITIAWEATDLGTVSAEVFASSEVGAYSYLLEDVGTDDHGDTPAAASPLVLATPVDGLLETPTDVDVFAVSLSGGRRYLVELSTSSSSRLNVFSASGASVPLDSANEFTPSESGTYYLYLAAFYAAGSYRLQLKER